MVAAIVLVKVVHTFLKAVVVAAAVVVTVVKVVTATANVLVVAGSAKSRGQKGVF